MDVSQIFHTLDPFPFRERDLDKEAEPIVSWARELPRDRPLRIVVHLPEAQALLPEAREIGAAILRYRARIIGAHLNELFRVGQLGTRDRRRSALVFHHHRPSRADQSCAPAVRGADCGELADLRMGRELATDRNILVRLVAACSPAQSLPAAGGSASGAETIQEPPRWENSPGRLMLRRAEIRDQINLSFR